MLLTGKKAVICGVANNKSIAYGIAKAFKDHGASIALSWPGEAIQKRVEPLAAELGADYTFACDVTDDQSMADASALVKSNWGQVDILVHAIAFANREDLTGRFLDTSREGFSLALDISAYSLVALSRAFEPLLTDNASIMTLTYYGSQKLIPNYNVMGVAKAALEASVRYLAHDFGARGIRVNGISAGPVKTLAASGISGFSKILGHMEQHAPLKHNVTIEEVGGTAVFLASDLSRAHTGEILYADCGYNISGIQLPEMAG